ncbi:hypothetical protein D9M73_202330 [compost metagenome]
MPLGKGAARLAAFLDRIAELKHVIQLPQQAGLLRTQGPGQRTQGRWQGFLDLLGIFGRRFEAAAQQP